MTQKIEAAVEPLIITDAGNGKLNVKFNNEFDRYYDTVRLLRVGERPLEIEPDESITIDKGAGEYLVLIQRSCSRVVYFGNHTF